MKSVVGKHGSKCERWIRFALVREFVFSECSSSSYIKKAKLIELGFFVKSTSKEPSKESPKQVF
jgi:hypothetical protein